ncbi:DUF4403 family protein [Solimonas terrae]|uniref:DUF4403 family protein n=1 Tax=Solimonas terrae TaxID=1396819 RepID=A0A6M2BKX8_9GAMM|nr:DUF4403 family protein [Solimonas terrae]NGY03366.1 DUF4403 family protein [Solimonas terrae]
MALAVCLMSGCTRHVETGEQLPTNPEPMPSLQRPSTVTLKASIPLSRLQTLLNDTTPQSWDIKDRLTAFRIKLHGALQRGEIVLSPAGRNIGFSSTVTGHGSAPVSWDVRGVLDGTLLPQVRANYRIASNLDAHASLSEAKLKLSLLPDISLRGLLEKKLAEQAPSARERLDAAVNRGDKLKAKAQRLWTTAFTVAPLHHQDDAYLVSRPTALIVSNPVLDTRSAAPAITLGLGITAELQTVYSKTAPTLAVAKLPPATIRNIDAGRIAIHLPLIAEPAVLAAVFTERLKAHKLKLQAKGVRILKIEAAGVGTQLVLRCKVRSEHWWRPLEAHLFVTGEPYLDETDRSIRLRNLDVTVQSRNALLGTAGYLLSPLLTQYIGEKAVYPLARLEAKAKRDVDRWAADLAEKSHGAVQANVTQVRIDSVGMQAGYVVVEASALGTVANDPEPWLPDR